MLTAAIRPRLILLILLAGILGICARNCSAQAALLLEEPYGFFGTVNPTGHNAIYFGRICAETPVKLRRCNTGENGSVIARYQGIAGYDWIAVPIVPYLYSVANVSEVPARADKRAVQALRQRYHEQQLLSLGPNVHEGSLIHGGWKELVGVSYERRMYAFQFATTPEQDDALIAELNGHENRSHFHLLYSNCADFARALLNEYFPDTFKRSFLPDAGMTTPKQLAFKLEKYAKLHPETNLKVFEIAQVPGSRRPSKMNKDIAEALITSGYAIPIAILNPYLAGGLFADFVSRGHFQVIPSERRLITPETFASMTSPGAGESTLESAGAQAPGAATGDAEKANESPSTSSGLEDTKVLNER